MRIIELTPKDLYELINNKELYLGLASRNLLLSKDELVMNYEGEGYRPTKITINLEYDENLKFSEEE